MSQSVNNNFQFVGFSTTTAFTFEMLQLIAKVYTMTNLADILQSVFQNSLERFGILDTLLIEVMQIGINQMVF